MAISLLLCPRCGASLSLLDKGYGRVSVAACGQCFVAASVGPDGALSSINLALIRKADRRRDAYGLDSKATIDHTNEATAYLT